MRLRKENSDLVSLIHRLQREPQPLWHRTAELLARPRRQRVEVNISKLDVYASDGAWVLVPGKVLGTGDVSKKLIVAAFSFSASAKQRIEARGGKTLSILELHQTNPKGTGVLVVV